MKAILFILGWFYYLTIQTLWTVLFNTEETLKWVVFRGGIKRWWKLRKEILSRLKSCKSQQQALEFVNGVIQRGEYRYRGLFKTKTVEKLPKWLRNLDKWPTWTASTFLILARSQNTDHPIYGNCQDCARLGKWLYRKMNRYHGTGFRRKLHIYIPVFIISKTHYIVEMTGELGAFIISGNRPDWRALPETKTEYIRNNLESRFPKGCTWLR